MIDNVTVTIVSYDADNHNMHVKFSDGTNETPVCNFHAHALGGNTTAQDILKKIGLAGASMLNTMKAKQEYSANTALVQSVQSYVNNPQTFSVADLQTVETFEVSI